MRTCGSTSSAGSGSGSPVPSGGCSQPTSSVSPGRRWGSSSGLGDPAADDRERRLVRAADRERGDHPVAVARPSCSRPDTSTVPSGTQVPSTITGWPTWSPGERVVGPDRLGQRDRLGAGSGPAASAARRSCHASYCQAPSSTAAATATSASRCTPQKRGASRRGTPILRRPGRILVARDAHWPGSQPCDPGTSRTLVRPLDHRATGRLRSSACRCSPSPAAPCPTRSSTRSSPRSSTARSRPARRCPASAGSPRCSASPARPSARPCSGWPRPGWSRSGRAARRRSATSSGPPASTCCPACSCARGNLDPPSPAASSRPGSSSAPASPPSPPSAAARRWPPPSPTPSTRWPPPTTTSSASVHALAFWDLVVDAADSLTFRLMFNSLRAAYEPALEALAPVMSEEVGQVGAYRVLTAAIGEGDPDTARAAAERVLRPATAQPDHRARRPRGDDMTKATPEIEALARTPAGRRRGADHRQPAHPGHPRRRLACLLAAPLAVDDLARSWPASVAARRAGRRRLLVGAGDPGRTGRAVPGDRVADPRRHPALAAAPRRPASRSTRCWPASTASTTPTRATSRWCSSPGRRWPGCCRRTSSWRCW